MADVRKNIDILIRAKDETQVGVAGAKSGMATLAGTVTALSAGYLALSQAIGQATRAVAASVQGVARFDALAKQLGTTTDAVQELDFIASQLDADINTLARGVLTLQKNATGLGAEAALAADALARIGLSAKAIEAGDPVSVLADIIERLRDVKSRSEQARIASDLFGRAYMDVLAILGQGSGAIRRATDEAHRLGLVLDPELVETADKAADAWDRFARRLEASRNRVILPLVDAMDKIERRAATLAALAEIERKTGGAFGRSVDLSALPENGQQNMVLGLLSVLQGRGGGLRGPRAVAGMPPPVVTVQPGGTGRDAIGEFAAMGAAASGQLGLARMGGYSFGSATRPFEMPSVADIEPILEMQQELSLEVDNTRDAYDAMREGLLEIEKQGESLGATLVDGAFQWADSWSRGMALVMTKQAEFSDIGKRLFRAMVTDMLAWINRLIARQIVAAVLNAIIGGGGGNVAGAIQTANAVTGSGGAVPMGLPDSGRAYRPPQVSQGDFGRPVIVQAQISTVFGSQGEVRAAASHLKRIMESA